MLTREEKKAIESQVEEWLTNMLGPVEPENQEEVGEFILKCVEDEIDGIIAFQQTIS